MRTLRTAAAALALACVLAAPVHAQPRPGGSASIHDRRARKPSVSRMAGRDGTVDDPAHPDQARYVEGQINAVSMRISRAEGEIGRIDEVTARHSELSSDVSVRRAELGTVDSSVGEKRTAVTALDEIESRVAAMSAEVEKVRSEHQRVEFVRSQRSAELEQSKVAAEKVAIWNRAPGSGRPLRAVWLTNGSGLTLDGGSIAVIDGSSYDEPSTRTAATSTPTSRGTSAAASAALRSFPRIASRPRLIRVVSLPVAGST